MIDRREMVKLAVIGVMGVMVAGSGVVGGHTERGSAAEPMRFSVEGDMGVVRVIKGGESIQVSGVFTERATFVLG
jgi:hypothetical protein